MPFKEFLLTAYGRNPDKRYLYYRSLNAKRNKPSSLESLGNLSKDFQLPESLISNFEIHSTVLRIATSGLQMWLHYDVCDNFLCCVRGRKRVVILPPQEVGNLYISDSSSTLGSRALSSKAEDLEVLWREFPLAKESWGRRFEAELVAGDVLFIPAFWPHCTEALEVQGDSSEEPSLSVSINVFVLHPEVAALHDPRDVWANRELLPAQDAIKAFEDKMLPALHRLPDVPRSFYCRKLAERLLSLAEEAESQVEL